MLKGRFDMSDFLEQIKTWNRRRSGPKTRPAFLRWLGYE